MTRTEGEDYVYVPYLESELALSWMMQSKSSDHNNPRCLKVIDRGKPDRSTSYIDGHASDLRIIHMVGCILNQPWAPNGTTKLTAIAAPENASNLVNTQHQTSYFLE